MGNFIPQYRIIYDNLKTKIQNGVYPPESRLPYESQLCEQYGVQRSTVRKALDMLVQDGLIYKRPGRGSFVCPGKSAEPSAVNQGTFLFVMNRSPNDILNNSSSYNAQLFFLMERLCRNHNYTLIYTGISEQEDFGALISTHGAKGAFLVSTMPQHVIDTVQRLQVPALCLNHYCPQLLSILPDNHKAFQMMISRLAQLGHRKIAFVSGPSYAVNAQERLQGFLAAMNECALEVDPGLILDGNWTYEDSFAATIAMLQTVEEARRPTALVTASDMMAFGALAAVSKLGLTVPTDISIGGFDNLALGEFCSPQLSSVGPSMEQMAHVAIRQLLAQLSGTPSMYDRYTIRVPVTYTDRSSVGPCPAVHR
ncbi:MAG: GntR family transcriptional regulator [Clostridia bacterium]|nr:GntR family transcriptional regulator [Clostridia bacterium]